MHRPDDARRTTRADAARTRRRSGAADEGAADQRHQLLPRSRTPRRARAARHPAAVRREEQPGPGARRGWPAARPAKRRTRSRCCWPSTRRSSHDPPAIQVFATDLDAQALAVAREGDLHRRGGRRRLRRAAAAVLSSASAGGLSGPPRAARAGAVRAPQRDQGSAVLASRSDLLPQPADLPESRRSRSGCSRRSISRCALAASCSSAARRPPTTPAICSSRSTRQRTSYESRAVTSAHRRCRRPTCRCRRRGDRPRLPDARRPSGVAGRPAPAAARAVRAAVGGRHRRAQASCTCRSAPARYLRDAPAASRRATCCRLVGPELRVDLRTALHQAAQQRTPVEVSGVRLDAAHGGGAVSLVVRPVLRDGDPARGYFLVLFEQDAAAAGRQRGACS